jgi:hypothetical protein
MEFLEQEQKELCERFSDLQASALTAYLARIHVVRWPTHQTGNVL